jgi:lipoyl(octanoyl) transferase
MHNGTIRPDLHASWLGSVEYVAAWELQRSRFEARLAGDAADSLLLLEHPHTYTKGRRTAPGDLLLGEEECRRRGIAVHEVDRGGRITYHGPGQLVGYPIVALGERYDVLAYLRSLEDGLLATLAALGVQGERDTRHTGVWVGSDKVAAIGVKITRGVTMHGFALNLSPELSMFSGIVPCGISDKGVTSVERLTGVSHPVQEIATLCAANMAEVFDRRLRWIQPDLEATGPLPALEEDAPPAAVGAGSGKPVRG